MTGSRYLPVSKRKWRISSALKILSALYFALASIGLSATAGGCAHLDFYRITHGSNGEQRTEIGGIRYYAPAPYLAIDVGAQGYCQTTIKWLPDYDREFEIEPHYWLGTVSLKPTLSDGWNLTALDSAVDTKIPEMVTALTGVMSSAAKIAAPSLAPSMTSAPGEQIVRSPGLYRLLLPGAKDRFGAPVTEAKLEPLFYIGDETGKALVCPKGKPEVPLPPPHGKGH